MVQKDAGTFAAWHGRLKQQAEQVWGMERATAIDGALVRMAQAISRIQARSPQPQTSPQQAQQRSPLRNNAADG